MDPRHVANTKSPFQNVGLVVKPDITPELVRTLGELAEHLEKRGISMHGDEHAGRLIGTEAQIRSDPGDQTDENATPFSRAIVQTMIIAS